MRVTNGMIRNTTLNGLYKNMNAMNKTYAQMTTGKKIQTVSDDPIIAGRALKLTTTVLETAQYESNVKEAKSWVEVTDTALDNITNILTNDIRTKCVQGATGTLNKENKESVRTQIEQLWQQIHNEANGTYVGRYIFSGYKTNEPLVLTEDYIVDANGLDVEENITLGSASKIAENSYLEANSTISVGSILGENTQIAGEFKLGIGTELSAADAKALLGVEYRTGKYEFNTAKTIEAETELTEEQATELNQLMSTDPTWIPLTADSEGKYKLKNDVTIPANTGVSNDFLKTFLGVDFETSSTCKLTKTTEVLNNNVPAQAYTFQDKVTLGAGSLFMSAITTKGETTLNEHSVVKRGSNLKSDSVLGKGTVNPEVSGKIDGHSIAYEIGVNNTININVEGMDEVLADISNCLNEICIKLDEALLDDSISNDELNKMFSAKIDEIDTILEDVSEKTSDLGSRRNRLVYVESRLSEQKLTFKELLSNTEDIDVEEVYVNFNAQYATYQSALQATSKIITNTLADYL